MIDVIVRAAEQGDVAALTRLDTVADHNPHRAEQLARWVSSAQCLCAERRGTILGYAVIARSFFFQPMLEMVMVDRAERGRGIGRHLILAAVEANRGETLWSSTNQSNKIMQHLLSALGFRRSGFVEGLDEGDPELIYRFVRDA